MGKNTFNGSIECLKIRGMMVSFGNASGPVLNIDVIKMIQPKGIYFTRPVMGQYLGTKDEIREGSEKLFEKIKSGQVKVKIYFNLFEPIPCFPCLLCLAPSTLS